MKQFSFFAAGLPATAGSKSAFPFTRKDGTIGVNQVDACKRGKSWRKVVQAAARKKYGAPGNCPIDAIFNAPLCLEIVFFLPRPKSHYGTGKNAAVLKATAPKRHTRTPDATKLQRAIEDALTGILWKDDCQVYSVQSRKEWCNHGFDGAMVTVINNEDNEVTK